MERQSSDNKDEREVTRASQPGGMARAGYGAYPPTVRDFVSAGPFSLMRRMSEEMDRVFGQFGFGRENGMWSPVTEIMERDGKYVVRAELPGLKPDDVKVQVTNDALILEGERKFENEENKGGIHRSERQYGKFFRSIPLPDGVKAEEIHATFDNGVLEVSVPVTQRQPDTRQIPIEARTGNSAGNEGSNKALNKDAGNKEAGNAKPH
ncbi:MAG TPA: Hsp20/alpha crystallin family protein [Bryobacteraceae bacterium]|nr:Hsp20/alpha crystallin family protein [Bryobacteraceae bacterium]